MDCRISKIILDSLRKSTSALKYVRLYLSRTSPYQFCLHLYSLYGFIFFPDPRLNPGTTMPILALASVAILVSKSLGTSHSANGIFWYSYLYQWCRMLLSQEQCCLNPTSCAERHQDEEIQTESCF